MSAPAAERVPSRGEELANCLSHGVGLVGVLTTAPFLIALAASRGRVSFLLGSLVFATSVVLLYAGSTLYHGLPPGRARSAFRVFDHCAIYGVIAGTYTPFATGVLGPPWDGPVLAVVWTLAGAGVLFELLDRHRHPRISLALYLATGWAGAVALRPLWERLPPAGFAWFVAGGIAYSVGARFYAWKRLRYGHLVWHLFVLAGTACHFTAVFHAA